MKNPHSSSSSWTTVGIYNIRLLPSFFIFSPRGDREGLLILIFPSILLRQGKKLFKLLHPLRLHLPSIKSFPIGLDPVEHIMLLKPVFRWIPVVGLYKLHHLKISSLPSHFPLLGVTPFGWQGEAIWHISGITTHRWLMTNASWNAAGNYIFRSISLLYQWQR